MPYKDPAVQKRYNTDYRRKYRAADPKRAKKAASDWYRKNRATLLPYRRRYIRELKLAVIEAYGGACRCCGERVTEFLTVDHARNDGAEHRRTLGTGTAFYLWLKRNGFPKRGFRLLCINCNFGRALNKGVCPHRRRGRKK